MRTHELKTWPEFFAAICTGAKTLEVRRDDRGFMVGDRLVLREYEPVKYAYTGREQTAVVTYKLPGGKWGIDPECCVLGLRLEPSGKVSCMECGRLNVDCPEVAGGSAISCASYRAALSSHSSASNNED